MPTRFDGCDPKPAPRFVFAFGVAVAFLAVLAGFAVASDESAGTVGGRSRGLAAIAATARDNGAALFGNPALLVGGKEGSLFVDAAQGGVAAAFRFGDYGAFGAGAVDLSRDDRFLVNQSWNPLGTFQNGRNRASAGYALALDSRLDIGATVDGWRSADDRWEVGTTLGLLAHPSPYVDIGATTTVFPSREVASRVGFSVRPLSPIRLHVEGAAGEFAFGGEASYRSLALRGGVRAYGDDRNPTISGGLSWRSPSGFQLHYAYEYERGGARLTDGFADGIHTLSFDAPLWKPSPSRSAPVAKTPSKPEPAAARPNPASNPASKTARNKTTPSATLPTDSGIVEPPMRSNPAPDELPSRDRPSAATPRRIVRSAVDPQLDIPANVRTLRELVEHHAEKYGVEVPLILAKMRAESAFNPNAVSSSNAVGLFQLLPPAARDMGLPLRDEDLLNPDRDPRFDPLMNADAGIRYLAHLLNRFGWNYALAVAAYNAGPSLVQSDIPPRAETERHVGKVLNFYYLYRNDPSALDGALRRLEAISSPTGVVYTNARREAS